MLYSTATLDRATGEMVSASLGEWLTISEVGRTYDTGPRRTRQILVHMGFLAPEGRRYRLPLEAVAKGWGKRLKNPSTGRPCDVVSPEGQRLIALGWADAAADLEAEESGEPEVAEATAALDTEAEKTLYERLKALTERGGGALLSIAHRPSVAPFHKRRWQLVAQPEGAPARYRVETAPIG